MKKTTSMEESSDPTAHSQYIQSRLSELIDHMREDVDLVTEPRFQALLETGAEVLTGLRTAYMHYDRNAEKAWLR